MDSCSHSERRVRQISARMQRKEMKTSNLSTEIFRDKQIPEFIQDHQIFRYGLQNKDGSYTPFNITKIFPSIGLPNYKEPTTITKNIIDIKKEGSFVVNMLRAMNVLLLQSKTALENQADYCRFLDDGKYSEQQVDGMFTLVGIVEEVAKQCDPTDKNVIVSAIHFNEGKITLRLFRNIIDTNGKTVFREQMPFFRVYTALYEKLAAFGIHLPELEGTKEFKTFGAENIPNKEYSLIFSSDGSDGAWDILTMAMRGIKSCQRWDGDHPQCLIGSVLSRFIGIIYITSGVEADTKPAAGTNGYMFKYAIGPKMMRRCLVRYVFDSDESKPHIVLDKMYPDMDEEVLSAFTSSIKKRSGLDVFYAPELVKSGRIKHLYMPSEDIRYKISDSEWSYQDAPIKCKDDIDISILNNHKEEVERDIKAFQVNLPLHFALVSDEIADGQRTVPDELKRIIKNLRINTSFASFYDEVCGILFRYYKAPSSHSAASSREYYKQYLRHFFSVKGSTVRSSNAHFNALLLSNTSRVSDLMIFSEFIAKEIGVFVRSQLKTSFGGSTN